MTATGPIGPAAETRMGERMEKLREWPVAFFDDDYLKLYARMLTDERTSAEVDFIVSMLGLEPGTRVLDLACGIGRHAVGVAGRGCAVTGLDFNAHYLEIGAERAAAAGVEVKWVRGDMRALGLERAFDAVYSYFTSFGYFSDAENESVIAGVARALRPGGRFLLDVFNREWILTHPTQRTWHQRDDGALHMEEATLDLRTSRVTSRQILVDPEGGHQVVKSYDLRVYTCAELCALLERHGFEIRDVWGGIDRGDYTTESRRLILTASLGAGA
jgi:ubiquinone/menaquinone biosynthesis C-methylase UbiE